MLYHVGCRILSSKELYPLYIKDADEYLNKFVDLFGDLYGKEFLSLNIHSLQHLAKDVENTNCIL